MFAGVDSGRHDRTFSNRTSITRELTVGFPVSDIRQDKEDFWFMAKKTVPAQKNAPPVRRTWKFCPRCGSSPDKQGTNPFSCSHCGYSHFFGPCTAVGCITLVPDGRMLFLIRGRDPGKGLYGLPGGFVDAGESVEKALRREVLEETGIRVRSFRYLVSFPNSYVYCGAALPVTDLFFVAEIPLPKEVVLQEGEVDGWVLSRPTSAVLSRMAFESNRKAIEYFIRTDGNRD
ncbi:MAG: NUDIX domain-containing protein [Planctomyces sp.]